MRKIAIILFSELDSLRIEEGPLPTEDEKTANEAPDSEGQGDGKLINQWIIVGLSLRGPEGTSLLNLKGDQK